MAVLVGCVWACVFMPEELMLLNGRIKEIFRPVEKP
jgi:hypothetical protein